jgi:hypothetical protein
VSRATESWEPSRQTIRHVTWSLIGGKREPIDNEKVCTLRTDRFDDVPRRGVRLFRAEPDVVQAFT